MYLTFAANCISTISFIDQISPVIQCQDTQVYEQEMPDLASMLNYTDNCGIQSFTQNVTVNSVLSPGNISVMMVVVDQGGNKYGNFVEIS